MIAQLYSSTVFGVDAFRVTVEVSLSGKGIGTLLTGPPDDAIKESLGRIDTAIQLCGYQMPRIKLVINLVPADVRKMGTAFDLPIALGILMASGQLHDLGKLKDYIIAGEMGLDGSIHPVRGTLSMAVMAMRQQFKGMLIPQANQRITLCRIVMDESQGSFNSISSLKGVGSASTCRSILSSKGPDIFLRYHQTALLLQVHFLSGCP